MRSRPPAGSAGGGSGSPIAQITTHTSSRRRAGHRRQLSIELFRRTRGRDPERIPRQTLHDDGGPLIGGQEDADRDVRTRERRRQKAVLQRLIEKLPFGRVDGTALDLLDALPGAGRIPRVRPDQRVANAVAGLGIRKYKGQRLNAHRWISCRGWGVPVLSLANYLIPSRRKSTSVSKPAATSVTSVWPVDDSE